MSLEVRQDKVSLRKILKSALGSKRGSNELMDAIIKLQITTNALLNKLDSDAGVTDTDYSDLAITPIVD